MLRILDYVVINKYISIYLCLNLNQILVIKNIQYDE